MKEREREGERKRDTKDKKARDRNRDSKQHHLAREETGGRRVREREL